MKNGCWLLSACFLLGVVLHLPAQTPPVELTELSLEELLDVSLIPRGSRSVGSIFPEGDASPSTWQIRYRYVSSLFEDYLDGTDERTAEEVTELFPVVPNRIQQEAHVFSLSHQFSDRLGVLLETSYIVQETDHIQRQGVPFTIRTEGLGDSRASAVYRLNEDSGHRFFITAGTSFPTGSIDEEGDTPRGKGTQVPYTMQLGSGTYDVSSSLAYFGGSDRMRWGGEVSGKVRLGRNDHGYSLGDRFTASTWAHYVLTQWLHPSLGVVYTRWGRIDGRDDQLNPTIAPVANPDLFGGTRLSLLGGFELLPRSSGLQGVKVGVECGFPIYQDLNGPQPQQEWNCSIYFSKRL